MNRSISVRTLQRGDIADCSRILYSLPDWFGLEASNRAYIDSLNTSPAAVAVAGNDIVGFIALAAHTDASYEINVMAVPQDRHRRGIGSALIAWAESWCRERRVPWLHVKTRGPSTPDPGYERTRQFYLAQGFEPLFESLTEWGPENAALVLVKHLACGR
jgi:GNAT superfamily N-acetyltransferase